FNFGKLFRSDHGCEQLPEHLFQSNRSASAPVAQQTHCHTVELNRVVPKFLGDSVSSDGFSRYLWSNGDTTAQTIINSAGNYTLKVGNAICMSSPSDVTTVTAANQIPKPHVQVASGSLSICGSGSVTLQAPSASGYIWSDGSSGQQISP